MSRGLHYKLEFVLLSAIAIAIILRLLNLGNREFWYDEVLSLLLSTGQKIAYHSPEDTPVVLSNYKSLLSLPAESNLHNIFITIRNLLRGIVGGEPHPPLFFLSQHLWLRLFGNSEAAMRSLGALLSVGALASSYGLGKVLLGHRGGLLLAALLGTNPYYLFHSLNVRMYAPLVFWTTLSAWALLMLIGRSTSPLQKSEKSPILWYILLIVSVAAGLLTFYLFAYWLVVLFALVILLDRRKWWQYGLLLGAGVLLTIPWDIWGIPQELRNADFGRFGAKKGFLAASWQHLQDVAQTLGIHLVLGDWVTSLPPLSATVAGFLATALLFAGSLSLWRQGERRLLAVAILMGIFPLLLALATDIASHKFTVGFGWGRSMIFILPGCLLLLAAVIERATGQWQRLAATVLLLLYLSISIGDFSFRQRSMFHQVANIIEQEPTTPTLIAIDSRAWGHVMRLAYYLPANSTVMLLSQESTQLAQTLQKILTADPTQYRRLIWLDSAAPIWSPPSTDAERQQVRQVLQSSFQLTKTQFLSGTMDLDRFTLNLYNK